MDKELFTNIKDGLQTVGEIELKAKIQELEKIIASQRHELSLQAKFREEDAHARQMLDPNACQRRVVELETVHDQREEHKKKLEDAYVEIERINKERKNISKGAEKNAHLANFYHTRWWNLIYFMDDIYPENWRGIWKEWQEKTGRLVGKEKDQVTVLETKLTESNERLKMIHYILSGGGVLGYRVDKAIRKIEKWQGEIDEQ